MSGRTQRNFPALIVTPGEPAGVGPDLAVELAQREFGGCLAAAADPQLLRRRAKLRGRPLAVRDWDGAPHRAGTLQVAAVKLAAREKCGVPDPANAGYVLSAVDRAVDLCLGGEFDAMVTGPLHKETINRAGCDFSGHTEYIAARCGAPLPVMLLCGSFRVALATTHLPLREVAAALSLGRLCDIMEILHRELHAKFGIARPRISVCGLNPHAGEGGRFGDEERDMIAPAVQAMAVRGIAVHGPLPADTAFTPARLADADVTLAMFHDQGLPVLKHADFGRAANVTLGLPIIRTSVDHGTALPLAGGAGIDGGSMRAAVDTAVAMARAVR
ncbi:MAG: 4-hydroxythreonine-4-phosphate dehydrogenase PdxA [Gammaproteobacteria bacterium]|nr:4-hydroxythreonine-4-phosphate dehydrogenase PdxA [Gammaproteobacteria bacterium]